MRARCFAVILFALLAACKATPKPDAAVAKTWAAAHHIDDFAIYAEGGDYFEFWFSVEDDMGQATISDGRLVLSLSHGEEQTCSTEFDVFDWRFGQITVGRGALQRDVVAFSQKNLEQAPCMPRKRIPHMKRTMLDAEIVFTTPDGKALSARDSLIL